MKASLSNNGALIYITELGIELAIVSETWERENESLETLLQIESHRVISYKRPPVGWKQFGP